MTDYGKCSDRDLILLLNNGVQRAMTEIFERYWQKLLAVALNRLDNLEEAEECVQDVFIKLWNLRSNLDIKYSLYTYLSAAVRYRVYDLLDKQYRRADMIIYPIDKAVEIGSEVNMADAYLLQKELLEQIDAAILRLPNKCRTIYRMSREDGRSHKQIADELDISEKTVEAHLTKAIKNLRCDLATEFPAIIVVIAGTILTHRI